MGLQPGGGPAVQLRHPLRRAAGWRAGDRRTGGGSGTSGAARRAGSGRGWPAPPLQRAGRPCARRPRRTADRDSRSSTRSPAGSPDLGAAGGRRTSSVEVVEHVAVAAGELARRTGRQSSRPRSDSAARCRPAAQPSVRSPRAATTASAACCPDPVRSSSAASSAVKRRSAARSSTSWPRARSRASGSGGSLRLAITRCSVGGRWSSRNAIGSVHVRRLDEVVVVEHQHDLVGGRGEHVHQRGDGSGRTGWRRAGGERADPVDDAGGARRRARRRRGARTAPGRCRRSRATARRPAQMPPASRPAGSTCRTRRARRPASAARRGHPRAATAVAVAPPDPGAAAAGGAW